jgi:hypothetical protein
MSVITALRSTVMFGCVPYELKLGQVSIEYFAAFSGMDWPPSRTSCARPVCPAAQMATELFAADLA